MQHFLHVTCSVVKRRRISSADSSCDYEAGMLFTENLRAPDLVMQYTEAPQNIVYPSTPTLQPTTSSENRSAPAQLLPIATADNGSASDVSLSDITG
jgi:hypothetical protein